MTGGWTRGGLVLALLSGATQAFVLNRNLHGTARSARSSPTAPEIGRLVLRMDSNKAGAQPKVLKRKRDEPKIGGVQTYAAPLLAVSMFLSGLAGMAPAAHAMDMSMSLSMGTEFLDRTVGPGFVQAFSLIFVSELGDKTFFIAALLSAKFSKSIAFVGAVGALVVMTFISVALGQVFHVVPSVFGASPVGVPLDDVVACLAFAYFGYRTLSEALSMEEDEKGGELEDAEEALAEFEASEKSGLAAPGAFGLVVQTFVLVFAAEFGDRSFLSTIALAAAQNPVSVATGAIVAHTVATAGAVAGGAILSEYISEKTVGLIGGTLFIVFAITTALGFF